jgi:isoquinoline 1-oxidoreductase subunit beta
VINLSGIDGQFESGVVWALSSLLKKEITFEQGRVGQSNFNDYPVIRMSESPVVDVHIVKSALRPFGVGEQPVPAVWPAVANAVFAATGTRLRSVPLAL